MGMCLQEKHEKQLTGWHMTVRFIPKIQTNKNSRESTFAKDFVLKQTQLTYVCNFLQPIPMEEIKNGYPSPTSSPPTPPSPLPISVGPGNQKYNFSSSPSPSPPFSPLPSSHTSAENLPLLQEKLLSPTPLAFSLDRRREPDDLDSRSSCLKDL